MSRILKAGFAIIFVAVASAAVAQSDGKLMMKLNYNAAAPLGNFKSDYIGNTSFRGGSGELSYWMNPKIAVGVNVGYQSYHQKYARQTYKMEGNQTISAVLTNTVETMPILVNGTYVPLAASGKKLQPYISAGAGLNLVNYKQYFGEFSDGNAGASFAAQAGAGFMVPLGVKLNNASLQLGANFNYMPYNKNGLKSLHNAGVNAGVVFPIK